MKNIVLKLTGVMTYMNPKISLTSIKKNQVVRVTEEQAEILNSASRAVNPDPEFSWFVPAKDDAKVDHDFTLAPETAAATPEVAAPAPKKPAQRVARTSK